MRAASALCLLLLACAGPGATATDAPPLRGPLLDLQGRESPLLLAPPADERPLVVHFWASWCPSCVEELGVLERASAACANGRVRVIAVNVAEDAETVESYLAAHRLALEVLRDPRGDVWRSAGFRALPANWFWTPRGSSPVSGPFTQAQWTARLQELGCAAATAGP